MEQNHKSKEMSNLFEKIPMEGVKNIIVVASGKGGGHKMAIEFDTTLLGQIPLVSEVGEAAEKGLSVFNQTNRKVMDSFEKIAELIISKAGVKS